MGVREQAASGNPAEDTAEDTAAGGGGMEQPGPVAWYFSSINNTIVFTWAVTHLPSDYINDRL